MMNSVRKYLTGSAMCAALVGAVVGGHAPLADAAEVTTDLTGTVNFISDTSGGVTAPLADRGVTVGAAATISYTLDDTIIADPNTAVATLYFDAVVTMTVKIGSYEARWDRPPGGSLRSNVSSGDNRFGFDTYTVQAAGSDSGAILGAGAPDSPVVTVVTLLDGSQQAMSDEGLIQDESKFPRTLSFVNVTGVNGVINITLDAPGGGGGRGGGDMSACASSQLKAAGKFGSAALKCMAKRAGQPPSKDPGGAKETACVNKHRTKYETSVAKAAAKAAKKGDACRLAGEDAGQASVGLLNGMSGIVGMILTNNDVDSRPDRALRGKLIKTVSAQMKKELAAFASEAKKSNAAKLQKKLEGAQAKAIKAMEKALNKAAAQGVDTNGLDSAEIARAVRQAVLSHVATVAVINL